MSAKVFIVFHLSDYPLSFFSLDTHLLDFYDKSDWLSLVPHFLSFSYAAFLFVNVEDEEDSLKRTLPCKMKHSQGDVDVEGNGEKQFISFLSHIFETWVADRKDSDWLLAGYQTACMF